ncbi:tetratricopeptide repeat protein [Thalassobaculum sp. OXR-137]|uniref:tetratricopeptide repeat-containing glycosyltransferase family protein n=1 Tax=Thalassobaculum sp. OXR-137 TaxID=3100173 RepID=UPI002AC90A47|nr:tetratricopeptide repeat protein [Thalassobaculum sp. OXR-137]WPZ36182.1 tetratricopeptide repeat protein [Thalassobaculum sp. OXR-137]
MAAETVKAILDRAVLAHRRGEEEAALSLYEQVLKADPINASANSNLAIILRRKGQIDRAAACLQRSVLVMPKLAAGYNNLGNLLRENGHRDKAPTQNKRCIVLSPFYAEGLNNLGLSMPDTELEKRVQVYRKSLILKPDYPEAWLNLANVSGANRLTMTDPTAGRYYRRTLLLNPTYATAVSSYGVYLASVGHLSEATRLQEEALRLDQNYEEAYFNLALYYLLAGRYHEGFSLYEHGIGGRSADSKRGHRRRVGQPRWNGEPLAGKTILVTAEQGVGDEIMFSSVLPELIRRAKHVYLESTPRLAPIMRRSFPRATIFAYNPANPSPLLGDRRIDYSVPLGSLPLYFRKSLADFGKQRPYAIPKASLARHFRHKYKTMFPGKLLVGFSWRGGSGLLRSRTRSLDQDSFEGLLSHEGVQAISLQYGVKEEEKAWFQKESRSSFFYDDTVEPLESMDLAMAQIAAMDVVISVTNAAVHCAGALGVPCWILVPHISDWRWTWGRTDVPWYPGMRSYRQESVGDWEAPLTQIRRDLAALLADGKGLKAEPAPDMDWRGDL